MDAKVIYYIGIAIRANGDLRSKNYPSFLTIKEGFTSYIGLLPLREEEETAPPRRS